MKAISAELQRRESHDEKRNIFGELMQGVAAMKRQREEKLTLHSYTVEDERRISVPARITDATVRRKQRRNAKGTLSGRQRV